VLSCKEFWKVLCPGEHLYICERTQTLLYHWRSVRIPHQFSLHNQWPRSLSKWNSPSKWNLLIPRELWGSTATSVFSPCGDSISTFKSMRWRVKGGAQLITPMCTCSESFAPPSKKVQTPGRAMAAHDHQAHSWLLREVLSILID